MSGKINLGWHHAKRSLMAYWAIPFEIFRGDGPEKILDAPPNILFFSQTPSPHTFYFFCGPPKHIFCNSPPPPYSIYTPQEHFYLCIFKGKNTNITTRRIFYYPPPIICFHQTPPPPRFIFFANAPLTFLFFISSPPPPPRISNGIALSRCHTKRRLAELGHKDSGH